MSVADALLDGACAAAKAGDAALAVSCLVAAGRELEAAQRYYESRLAFALARDIARDAANTTPEVPGE